MTTAFPNLEPTSRSFKPPEFPTSTKTSQSGVITRRLYGSLPGKASLSLSFNNITDTQTSSILSAYKAAKGPVDDLSLPVNLFAGADPTLTTYLDTSAFNASLVWSFAEGSPPAVQSVAPGVSSVSVNLVAELRMS